MSEATPGEHAAAKPMLTAPATEPAARQQRKEPAPARRARLTVSRVNLWSVLKLSFLLSVAAGVAGVALTAAAWSVLSSMGLFASADRVVNQVVGNATTFHLMDYLSLGQVIPLAIVIAIADILLFTALATLSAMLYNVASALVNGLQVTLSDD